MNRVIKRKEVGYEAKDGDIELVQMLADGARPHLIASKLGKSRRTIESRIDSLRGRVGSKTVPELIADFFRAGLLT